MESGYWGSGTQWFKACHVRWLVHEWCEIQPGAICDVNQRAKAQAEFFICGEFSFCYLFLCLGDKEKVEERKL
jgi:hypothetical protein